MEIILTKVKKGDDFYEKVEKGEEVAISGIAIVMFAKDGSTEKELVKAQKFELIEDMLTDEQKEVLKDYK